MNDDSFRKYRNPIPVPRPTFQDILTFIIGDEEAILAIPSEDASTDPEACHLGAPLQAGQKMYLPLQTKYLLAATPTKEVAAGDENYYEEMT